MGTLALRVTRGEFSYEDGIADHAGGTALVSPPFS